MEVGLSDSQYDFIYSDETQVLFCGGVGSGKTFSGALWTVITSQMYPNTRGLITANTHSQLQKATLAELFNVCDMMGIKYRYLINQNRVFIGKSEILCYTMEKPENLAGPTVGYWWGDEVAFYRKLAFDKAAARVRDKKGPGQIRFTTTPNGFNWLYDHFIQKPAAHKKVVYSSTMDNAENLQDDYIVHLRESYDERMSQQELDGHFVNMNSGLVYYSFDRRKHVKQIDYKDGDRLLMGLDFNVHPLCGVFAVKRGEMVYIVDELYLEHSNTFDAAKQILRKFPRKRIEIVADETGNRRKTASTTTDHEILRRAGLDLLAFQNPRVKDRYNNMNRLFDRGYIKIHPRCTKLIKDLEVMTHENDDPLISHISDALGYLCWKLNPLKKPKRRGGIYYK